MRVIRISKTRLRREGGREGRESRSQLWGDVERDVAGRGCGGLSRMGRSMVWAAKAWSFRKHGEVNQC